MDTEITQKLPKITGMPEYVSLLDRVKVHHFLEAQGMQPQAIEELEIVFEKHSMQEYTRSIGLYCFCPSRIVIIASSLLGVFSEYTEVSQRELLLELNETLMQQISYALDATLPGRCKQDRRNCLLALCPLYFFVWGLYFSFFLMYPSLLVSLLFPLFFVLQVIIVPKIWFFFEKEQRRAKRFQESFATSVLLFRSRK